MIKLAVEGERLPNIPPIRCPGKEQTRLESNRDSSCNDLIDLAPTILNPRYLVWPVSAKGVQNSDRL